MKAIEVMDDYYAKDPSMKANKKDPKFKAGGNLRISKYKNILLKDIFQIGQKKFLLLIKLKIQFLRLMLLEI